MEKSPAVLDLRLMDVYPPLSTALKSKYTYYQWKEVPEKRKFLAEHGATIRGIVTNPSTPVNEFLISDIPNLGIVACFSVGVDNVDLQFCKQRGVIVTNTPDVLTDAVADTAMALILASMRRICAADQFVRKGGWRVGSYPLTTQVSGKRIGIVGLGRIGAATAKRAEGFGCRIGYWNRSEKKEISYKYFGSLVDLANNSDILVVACALTEETTRIINREVLDALGPKGYLINIARGLVVDETELVQALVEGRLGGAGLDVYESEPHVPEELLKMDNVVVLPHSATDTWETSQAMADLVVGNLDAHFSGKPLLTHNLAEKAALLNSQ